MARPVEKGLFHDTFSRLRKLSEGKKGGLTKKAACCLDSVKLLMKNLRLEENMQVLEKISKNVRVLKKMSGRLIKKRGAQDLAISKDVAEALSRAEASIRTAAKICELNKEIETLKSGYFNNRDAEAGQYIKRLDNIGRSVETLEREAGKAGRPDTIVKGIEDLKKSLQSAYKISKLRKHPRKIVDKALSKLREVSQEMQNVRSSPEITRAFRAVEQVNDDLARCGEECMESVRGVNQVIGEYMLKFIDSELRVMEKEFIAPFVPPKSPAVKDKLSLALNRQKEKLTGYQKMIAKLRSGRIDDIKERIAFALEDIDERLLALSNLFHDSESDK